MRKSALFATCLAAINSNQVLADEEKTEFKLSDFKTKLFWKRP